MQTQQEHNHNQSLKPNITALNNLSHKEDDADNVDNVDNADNVDIIIVGAGAAGIGLLYGLLLPFDGSTKSKRKPNFTIAVIERGGSGGGSGSSGGGKDDDRVHEPCSKDPKEWFQASHPLFFGNNGNNNNNKSDVTIYNSLPQKGLNNRKLIIPTGKNLGGCTNINATLITKPNNDDFKNWPKYWNEQVYYSISSTTSKKMSRIMAAIHIMENAMLYNGALSTQTGIDLSNTNTGTGTRQSRIQSKNEQFIQIKGKEDIDKIKLHAFTCAAKPKGDYATSNERDCDNDNDKDNDNSANVKYERVNAYQALIIPLLERNPSLKEIVHFYTNVQVERLLIEKKLKTTSSSSSSHEFVVRGVECKYTQAEFSNKKKNKEYFQMMARRKVILSAGAILSPALLLVSGIGDDVQLKREGIVPLRVALRVPVSVPVSPSLNDETISKSNDWKYVGKNIRDHLIITKAFVIPPRFWTTMNSINAIRGWAALDIFPFSRNNNNDNSDDNDNNDSDKNHMSGQQKETIQESHDHDHHHPKARVFFKLVDGTSSSFIIPYVLASYFNRQNDTIIKQGQGSSSSSTTTATTRIKLQNLIIPFLNTVFKIISYLIRIVLTVLLHYTPLKLLVSRCTVQILLCILNPDSTGFVTIKRKKSIDHHHHQTTTTASIKTTSTISRLSDFDIIVDPGYLTHKSDMIRIENSWEILNSLSDKWFSSSKNDNCYEVLPGFIYKWIFGKDDYLKKYAADFALPYFHWSGTVSMKTDRAESKSRSNNLSLTTSSTSSERQRDDNDDSFVVDERLNVRHIKNLHVCDASVFPENISGPLVLTCLGLGLVTSSFILDECEIL